MVYFIVLLLINLSSFTIRHIVEVYDIYLNSTKGIKEMRIMVDASRNPSIFMLALLDELKDTSPIHSVKLAHYVHSCEAPVYARHSQVLCHTEFIVVLVIPIGC